MYDTTERVRRVKLRAEELRRKGEKRLIGSLFTLCAMLSIFLVGAIGNIGGRGGYTVPGFYGATLMYEDAGSYVLVGIISFVSAVTITMLCVRSKDKNKKIQKNEKDE